ncbi:MAG: HAD family hydrolase [Desulfovibrio sp.]|jgi:phosphoglycolate phosphatase-like HAD superfamily hydrolase|nr:HAD family hydrolase [Desulfovibrio sp.]
MALSLIVFDCDGIILESVDVKTQAFARIGEAFGQEASDRIVAYHRMHGGVSRYKKFEWLYQEVLHRTVSPEKLDSLNREFTAHAYDAVMHCPLVPGIREVLDLWHGRVPMYVDSGAPHAELVQILSSRGLSGYFDGIYGSPPEKTEILRNIVDKVGVHPADAVMIGDSITDQHAAEAVQTRFYGRGDFFKHSGHPWYDDLTRLNDYLETLFAEP